MIRPDSLSNDSTTRLLRDFTTYGQKTIEILLQHFTHKSDFNATCKNSILQCHSYLILYLENSSNLFDKFVGFKKTFQSRGLIENITRRG